MNASNNIAAAAPDAISPQPLGHGFRDSTGDAEERVRRYYALVDVHDVTGLVALFASDAVYHRPGYEPLAGHRDLRRFYQEQRVIAHGQHTVTDLLVDGNRVAVHGEFNGALRSGDRVAVRFADFFALTQELLFARRDTYFFAPVV